MESESYIIGIVKTHPCGSVLELFSDEYPSAAQAEEAVRSLNARGVPVNVYCRQGDAVVRVAALRPRA